jgi:hypothetical protein
MRKEIANIREFRRSIRRDIEGIKKILKDAAFKAMDEAIEYVADESKVWSGSFVCSNRIGVNEKNAAAPTDLKRWDPTDTNPKYPIKVTKEEETAVRVKATSEMKADLRLKRKEIQPFGQLHMTNRIEYADAANAWSGDVYTRAARVADLAAEKEFKHANSIDKNSHL